jgi:hypothetical protein
MTKLFWHCSLRHWASHWNQARTHWLASSARTSLAGCLLQLIQHRKSTSLIESFEDQQSNLAIGIQRTFPREVSLDLSVASLSKACRCQVSHLPNPYSFKSLRSIFYSGTLTWNRARIDVFHCESKTLWQKVQIENRIGKILQAKIRWFHLRIGFCFW